MNTSQRGRILALLTSNEIKKSIIYQLSWPSTFSKENYICYFFEAKFNDRSGDNIDFHWKPHGTRLWDKMQLEEHEITVEFREFSISDRTLHWRFLLTTSERICKSPIRLSCLGNGYPYSIWELSPNVVTSNDY